VNGGRGVRCGGTRVAGPGDGSGAGASALDLLAGPALFSGGRLTLTPVPTTAPPSRPGSTVPCGGFHRGGSLAGPRPPTATYRPLMRLLRRIRRLIGILLGLGWRKRIAVLRATVLLLLARAALVVFRFPTVLRLADRVRPRTSPPGFGGDLRTMVWAVTVVGNRLFPTSPCLTQAVVVHRLFRRSGRPAELLIGVRKDGKGKFGAHAWVESAGRIIIGGEALSDGFVRLPPVRSDGLEG